MLAITYVRLTPPDDFKKERAEAGLVCPATLVAEVAFDAAKDDPDRATADFVNGLNAARFAAGKMPFGVVLKG